MPEISIKDMVTSLVIPSDEYALELANQINSQYGTAWIPEYVQYLATKADLFLDDCLEDFLDLYAYHETFTKTIANV